MANSASIFPEPPRHFRSLEFAGTVVDVDLVNDFVVASANLSGCPERTPPSRLLIENREATAQDLVLTGEDGVDFTVGIPPSCIYPHDGGVTDILAAGSGTIYRVVAIWWSGNRQPRRNPNP
jgi:hypothetical protein